VELTSELLFQAGAVIASLSGAWALVRSQVNTLKINQEDIKQSIEDLVSKIEDLENDVAVVRNQIDVFKNILSPANLAEQHRRRGYIDRTLKQLEDNILVLQHMHNGKHPPINL
jgi:archaellum component FlaC